MEFISRRRVLTAIIFMAVTIAAAIYGSWLFGLYMIILIVVGIDELTRLLNHKEIYPAQTLIYLFAFLFIVAGYINKPGYFGIITSFGIIIIFINFLFVKRKTTINDITATIFAVFYTGLLPVHFLLLRNLTAAGYLLLTFMTIWTSDIGAYFIGKKYGKHKLCENISPKKTIEGAIGGTLSGIIMAVLMSLVTDLNIIHSLILGIIIVIFAQLGDLCESLIKRDAGVKDSGDIVPGHGGILDRADSYIFSGPAAYYYIKWVVLTGLL